MKKLVLALAMLASSSVFAAPTSPESCQLKINGQVLWEGIHTDANGQGFFAAASQYSQRTGSCVHAKIDQVPNSGRVYDNGQLVPAYNGQKKGLSNSEANEAKSRVGGGCMTLSCIPLEYNKMPQYEQPVQIPDAGYIPPPSSGSGI
jgi:hypothetical protein